MSSQMPSMSFGMRSSAVSPESNSHRTVPRVSTVVWVALIKTNQLGVLSGAGECTGGPIELEGAVGNVCELLPDRRPRRPLALPGLRGAGRLQRAVGTATGCQGLIKVQRHAGMLGGRPPPVVAEPMTGARPGPDGRPHRGSPHRCCWFSRSVRRQVAIHDVGSVRPAPSRPKVGPRG